MDNVIQKDKPIAITRINLRINFDPYIFSDTCEDRNFIWWKSKPFHEDLLVITKVLISLSITIRLSDRI